MKQIVGEVAAAIEREIKPTLANTAEHKGFCTALAAVNERLGKESIVVRPGELRFPVCPDCGVVMEKGVSTDFGLPSPTVVWTCECVPDSEKARGDQEIEDRGGEGF